MTEISPDLRLIPAWRDGKLQALDKLEVHKQGLRHKAVSIFVFNRDRLLLQQRALTKYHTPGLWTNSCCTHPNWGESNPDCALRRLNEELGISGLTLNPRGTVNYRADVGQGMTEDEEVALFVAEAPDELAIDANPQEVMGVRWLDKQSLEAEMAKTPTLFTPWLHIYLSRPDLQIWR